MEILSFDMINYLPKEVICGKNFKKYPLIFNKNENHLFLFYLASISKGKYQAKRKYSYIINRHIKINSETFEVVGLLQAEMGKTQNGCLNFANHEFKIINKVMNWFEKELELRCKDWKWYIKVNINEPSDNGYKKEIEEKIINHWLNKTKIDPNMCYPKTVSYIKNTKNKVLRKSDYGTLIIERKKNLLSQIIKRFVKSICYNIVSFETSKIRSFMKGIIAGEGCIEIYKPNKRYRVIISAVNPQERKIFKDALNKLGISSIYYKDNKDLIISQKENLLKLLKQKLVCLSPKKYDKFLSIFPLYDSFPEYESWKNNQTKPHNKISNDIIDKIIKLHHKNPNWPAYKIAALVGVSSIKVQRVLKENNLGKRLIKTPEEKRKEIAEFVKKNSQLTQKEVANIFKVTDSVVRRSFKKYKNI
jgi:hypothetical protein